MVDPPETLSSAWRAVSVTFRTLVARSKSMRRTREDAERVAGSSAHCLLLGETGTGKNLVAQAIHNASPMAGGPFVSVNCSAIPESLVEAELFGTEAGAFTDARQTRRGRFELAIGGTLFLDEIGDLSLAAQAKILHAIEYREFSRVGGEATLTSDARLIAATNLPVEQLVEQGRFRRDLFYRLNEVVLRLPPLRERPEDIPALAERFLEECAEIYHRPVRRIEKATLKLLTSHSWPGNVRELRAVIKRGVARCAGDTLTLDDLQLELRLVDASPEADPTSLTLAQSEARHIRRVLDLCGWVKSEAARRLEVSRPTLDRKIALHKLAPEED